MRIAVAAIVKNESPSLLEWLAYHRAVGIKNFIIVDNNSTDATWPLLKSLRRRGVVSAMRFPTLAGQAPQIDAYQAVLNGPARQFDIVAFLDADEYLVPTDDAISVIPAIENLFADDGVSSVVMNWACFGSSGAVFRGDGLVPERFTRRAEQGHPANRHYKSMVRPERVVRFYNPHEAWVASGRTVNTAGEDLVVDGDRPHGFSRDLCWQRLRVNHYVVKSMEEFLVRKSQVGNASWPEKAKHRRFFEGHDRNEVKDTGIVHLIDAVRAECRTLNASLERRQGVEKLNSLIQVMAPVRRFSYLRFLLRRVRLYGVKRIRYGSLSLKEREE